MSKRVWFFPLVLILVLGGYCIAYTARVVQPAIIAVAEIKVQSMISHNINDAILEKFAEEFDSEELFQISTDENGKVALLQTDTAAMNRLAADLTGRIQKKLFALKEERVDIPIGTVLGNSLLSQIGPSFQLKVIPLSTAEVNYTTEFESAGVNQTRHKIYLQVDSTARILAPFAPQNIEVHNQILIAETVVVGDVPQSFIYVPKEDVLDSII